ncbi:MAG: UPF0182 family protein, partial [Vicinamibacterales bacterium]
MDWTPSRQPRRRGRALLFIVLALVLFGGGTTLSYYVDSLWFASLGFSDVFWTTLRVQGTIFSVFLGATFFLLYAGYFSLKPAQLDLTSGPILINGQPIRLPVEPVLRMIALVAAAFLAVVTGLGMMAQWTTFALYWNQAPVPNAALDPIFGRPATFYLFTLPVWQLVAGWLTTLAVIVAAVAAFFAVITGGSRVLTRTSMNSNSALRGVSIAASGLLLAFAAQAYIGRFSRILQDHT